MKRLHDFRHRYLPFLFYDTQPDRDVVEDGTIISKPPSYSVPQKLWLNAPGAYLRPAFIWDPAFIRTRPLKPPAAIWDRRLIETRRLIEVLRVSHRWLLQQLTTTMTTTSLCALIINNDNSMWKATSVMSVSKISTPNDTYSMSHWKDATPVQTLTRYESLRRLDTVTQHERYQTGQNLFTFADFGKICLTKRCTSMHKHTGKEPEKYTFIMWCAIGQVVCMFTMEKNHLNAAWVAWQPKSKVLPPHHRSRSRNLREAVPIDEPAAASQCRTL